MKIRCARWAAAVALVAGLVAPAGAQTAARPQVEKITLQHIDARIVAAALGLPVLPNELEVMQGRAYGGFGGGYGGFGGYGSGAYLQGGGYLGSAPYNGFGAAGYGYPANGSAGWAQPALPQPTAGGVVDPRTNSYLYRR